MSGVIRDAPLRWLHLSDLHLGPMGGARNRGPNQQARLEGLLAFLERDGRDSGAPADFVLITGDLAATGSHDEYVGPAPSVEWFLDRLTDATGVPKARIFPVPGNHDVRRDSVPKGVAFEDLSVTTSGAGPQPGDAVDALRWPASEADRELATRRLDRLRGYADFCLEYWGPEHFGAGTNGGTEDVLWYAVRVQLPRDHGYLGIAGLPTPWLSQSRYRVEELDDAEGTLAVCASAARSLTATLDREGECACRVALMHHPQRWLLDDEWDRLLGADHLGGYDIILTGHTHRPSELFSPPPTGPHPCLATGGAGWRDDEGSQTVNQMALDPTTRAGWFRVVANTAHGWQPIRHWERGLGGLRAQDQWVDGAWYPFSLRPPSPLPCPTERVVMYQSSEEAAGDIKERLEGASEVSFIGTGINVLQQDVVLSRLERQVQDGQTRVTVCMANPHSRFVEIRLFEEELGSRKPWVGAPGIAARLETLLECERRFGPDRFRVLLFNHYPTMCIIRIDETLFVYPYGYQKLGNYSPTFRLDLRDSVARAFFEEQEALLLKYAVPAGDYLESRRTGWRCPTEWPQFAVYIIPTPDNSLYQIGSRVLGHDIRARTQTQPPSELAEAIGPAQFFGFHMTVGDALYAQSDEQVHWIRVELQAIAQAFRPFNLTNGRFCDDLRSRGIIGLEFDDPTGTLDALHAEVAVRINVQAVGSNYTQVDPPQNLDTGAPEFAGMLSRYKAPFVFGRFLPHFTLLSGLEGTDDALAARTEELEAHLRTMGVTTGMDLPVGSLCLVERGEGAYWRVRDEVFLRGGE